MKERLLPRTLDKVHGKKIAVMPRYYEGAVASYFPRTHVLPMKFSQIVF